MQELKKSNISLIKSFISVFFPRKHNLKISKFTMNKLYLKVYLLHMYAETFYIGKLSYI